MKTLHHLVVCIVILLLHSATASAHKLAPSLLALHQQSASRFDVSWKTPRFGPTPVTIEPRLPADCQLIGQRHWAYEDTGVRGDWIVDCAGAFTGQTIHVDGLAENQSAVLLRIEWQDGTVSQDMLDAANPDYLVKGPQGAGRVVGNYMRLGMAHILTGPDHLLFVLGLVLLVSGRRKLVWTITAFTLGHSITLALAVLGYLRYPVNLVEFGIAVSIFVVAVELASESVKPGWLRRQPWLAAACFGLLHGMGFAGALREVGLPPGDIPLALFSFNVGIEIGQLVFVMAVLLFQVAWLRLPAPRWPILRWVPVYTIGILSAFWCIQRGATAVIGG